MRPKFYIVVAAIVLLSICPFRSWGQEEKPQLLFGDFDTTGTVSVGYRFTTIKGDEAQYDNLFDLHKGFRLMDVNLMGRAPEGSHLFADSYSVIASGLGGDPYSAGQLTLRKDKLYDLRVNYGQSYYYWNQNNIDSQVMAGLGVPVALGGSPSGFTKGLTPNHNWATVHRLGSANLDVRATNHLQFSFEYSRNSRDGITQTTRNLYYVGNPSPGWGSFSTANPYVMAAPLDELTNRITGGISYTLRGWTFHYHVGYQSFTQNTSWNNLMSPEQSINTSPNVFTVAPPGNNVNAITSRELLTSASWSEFRRLTTPVSEFSYDGKVNSWLELRGGYNFYRYSGPDTTNASFLGTARTNSAGTTFGPYAVSLNARASVDEPTHEVSQGLTAKITEWWNFFADYRYTRIITDGLNDYSSVYNGTAAAPGNYSNKWLIGTHFADLNMEFVPTSSLVIRAGIRYVKRDVEQFTNGVINTVRSSEVLNASTLQTKSVWPTVSVFYKPVKIFSVRGDFQSNTSSDPYTRVSAHTDVGSRFVFRLQPTEKVSIEDNLMVRDRMFADSSYRNQYRSNAINVSYDFSNRFSANAGYSYESIFGRDAHFRSNATTPFDGFWQDAFINRGWRGSLIVKPVKGFGINLSGNFLRTTGASRLFSTAPASALGGLPIVWPVEVGPLTFPLITSTLYYDFPKAGRLSIDLQRTYYIEQLVTGNNFQANLLTIKWTKNINPPGQ